MKKKITALLAGIFAMGISSFAQTPSVTFTGTPTSVCADSKVTFTNTSTNTPTSWTWYFPGGSPSYTVITTGTGNPPPVTYFFPGTYAVSCVVKNTFGKDSDGVSNYITVLPLPKATVMPPSGGICDNAPLDTVYFSMADTTAGNTYTWLPSASLSCANCENPKAFPSVNTVYTITVTNGACSITLYDTVISGGNPLIGKITGRDSICSGSADTLYASGGAGNNPLDPPGTTYRWSNGKTTSTIIVNPTFSTTYTCFMTSGTGGCPATGTFMVNVYPLPHFTIESPDSICYPSSAIITTSPPTGNPYEYIWFAPNSSPDTTDIFTVKPPVTTTYTLVTINQGCRFDSVVKIKVNNPPTVIFTGATNLCQYSSTTICAFGGDQYHWSYENKTSSCINVVPPASITYTLGVFSGACYVDTTFTIIVDTMPTVRFKGDTSICSGDSTIIYVVPGYDYTYLWNTGSTADSVIVGSLKNGGTPILPGKYIYYLTVTKGACSKDSEQIAVKVYPHPLPTVYPLDTTVCEFNPITLTATGAVGGGYYIWSPKNSGLNHYLYYGQDTDRNVATPTATTVYSVKVCTWGCCKDTSLRLNIIPNVQGAMVCCDTTVSIGTPVNLSATFTPGPYSVEGWSPATGLSCTNCANPTATDNATTTYVVTFLDLVTSCFVNDSVTVTIFNCNVFVPNVFSPNGDGVNDVLYVRSLCMKTMDFDVFDRFGNKVFESLNINDGWDGTYHGKPMEIGTYMWYLTGLLEDGTHLSKSGNVTIIR